MLELIKDTPSLSLSSSKDTIFDENDDEIIDKDRYSEYLDSVLPSCKNVMDNLPMEFAIEAKKLLETVQ